MAKVKQNRAIRGTEKEFLDVFNELCTSRMAWQAWADVISVMACSLSNVFEFNPARRERREKEYEDCIKRLGGNNEIPARLLAIVTTSLDENPEQDFLGKMYMNLNLGNHWTGQFFTPYSVCKCMAGMTISDTDLEKSREKDYISVCDPACGAGATLIAAANMFRERNINYQQKVMFVGQDIDRVVAQMCFIQLSLLGCPGYIVVADSLCNPVVGNCIQPVEKEGQEFWYTPFYSSDIWTIRRFKEMTRSIFGEMPKQIEQKQFAFFFDLDKEEQDNGRKHKAG